MGYSRQELSELIIEIVVLLALITVAIIAIPSVSGMAIMPGNRTSSGVSNMTFVGNMMGGRTMMMPEGKKRR
jgi:hypothetical protein